MFTILIYLENLQRKFIINGLFQDKYLQKHKGS